MNNPLDSFLADFRLAERTAQREQEALEKAEDEVVAILSAQEIAQRVAETIQASAHRQIASVVTKCLEAIFGDESYQFEIKFERKRGKTDAVLTFKRDDLVLEDPLNEAGGGTVCVAAFALQLACLKLAKPKRRQFLAMDEPFVHLHGSMYRKRLRAMILELSKEIQMILFTQDAGLEVGRVVELE